MIEKGENGVSPPKNYLYKNRKKITNYIFSSSNFNQNLWINNENYFGHNCMSRRIEKQGKGKIVSPQKRLILKPKKYLFSNFNQILLVNSVKYVPKQLHKYNVRI